jgi:hypothetical protein
MEYDSADNALRFCDGSTWFPMGAIPGAGGAGCSSPAAQAGALDFSASAHVYRYCDGTNWIDVD